MPTVFRLVVLPTVIAGRLEYFQSAPFIIAHLRWAAVGADSSATAQRRLHVQHLVSLRGIGHVFPQAGR